MREHHLRPSPISATVDFEANGVQHGFLRLPYSRDDSAWGSVMIPVTVVKNGEGPTALLTGGNHGDEYEGPIALFDLARKLDASDVEGRVIIVPAMNYPAFQAQTRTSPIDKGNMNRSFPGGRMEQSPRKSRITSSVSCCRSQTSCSIFIRAERRSTSCRSARRTFCPTRPRKRKLSTSSGRSERPIP